MATARTVKFESGVSGQVSVDSAVGQRLSDVLPDLTGLLDLYGDETAQVRKAGARNFNNVDEDYVLRAGDTVRFSREAGEKGI